VRERERGKWEKGAKAGEVNALMSQTFLKILLLKPYVHSTNNCLILNIYLLLININVIYSNLSVITICVYNTIKTI